MDLNHGALSFLPYSGKSPRKWSVEGKREFSWVCPILWAMFKSPKRITTQARHLVPMVPPRPFTDFLMLGLPSLGSSRSWPQTRVWVPELHLWGDPWTGAGKWAREGREAIRGHTTEQVTNMGRGDALLLGSVGSMCKTYLSYPHLGCLPSNSHEPEAKGCSPGISFIVLFVDQGKLSGRQTGELAVEPH